MDSDATTIGLAFSQRPLSGERKSGIPEGVEIPAPDNAIVWRAFQMRDAAFSINNEFLMGYSVGAICKPSAIFWICRVAIESV